MADSDSDEMDEAGMSSVINRSAPRYKPIERVNNWGEAEGRLWNSLGNRGEPQIDMPLRLDKN